MAEEVSLDGLDGAIDDVLAARVRGRILVRLPADRDGPRPDHSLATARTPAQAAATGSRRSPMSGAAPWSGSRVILAEDGRDGDGAVVAHLNWPDTESEVVVLGGMTCRPWPWDTRSRCRW